MTKFSVLLPTRNRLEYLKYAVDSVLKQNHDNWEIIISDNCSEQNIEEYVISLADSRIKYFCTPTFISVTENWNYALEKSTGDYVIMLGDDDCLTKDYFQTVLSLIEQFQQPDLLFSSAFLYAYPGVIPQHPNGQLHKWGNACFLEGKSEPYVLEKKEAIRIVKESMNFKVMFNFNMQFALVHRSLINELQQYGPFFQSPYPDYYAMTVLLLKARRILAIPDPLVIVGITPKSFGFYYEHKNEKDGVEFLKNLPEKTIFSDVEKYLLPGTEMNSSWLFALQTVKKNYGHEFSLKVNYRKYRMLQILHQYKQYIIDRSVSASDLRKLSKKLRWWEKLFYYPPLYFLALAYQKNPYRKDLLYNLTIHLSHPPYTMIEINEHYQNISEVFEKVSKP